MRGEKSQRAWIYAIVGVYLLYTAWQLFQGLGDSEEPQVLFAVFTVFFAVAGVVLIWFAIQSMKKGNAQKDNAQEDNVQEANAQEDSTQEGSEQENSAQEDNGADSVQTDSIIKETEDRSN